jgi:hypothetical protein
MTGIVLADNFIMTFIFWELVGLSSYLLIGHWYQKDSAADAAKKAFLTNRIGDFGFMIGILMMWGITGTLVFSEMNIPTGVSAGVLGAALLCVFCGAVGKSAQLPLHVWLPDAMEGPTPVSALIHAATMVAAGVYMLFRVQISIGAEHFEGFSGTTIAQEDYALDAQAVWDINLEGAERVAKAIGDAGGTGTGLSAADPHADNVVAASTIEIRTIATRIALTLGLPVGPSLGPSLDASLAPALGEVSVSALPPRRIAVMRGVAESGAVPA